MKNFRAFGPSTSEETQRERDHRLLARKTASEGFVLLKNNGVLPLKPQKIALFGAGARMTVKGGSGSGNVQERSSVSIEQGLLNAGFTLENTLSLDRCEADFKKRMSDWKNGLEEKASKYSPIKTMDMFIMIGEHPKPQPGDAPVREDELTDEADTAIYVLARQAGEGGDRRKEKGDYYLSDNEIKGLKLLSEHYNKLILIINCGGVVDLSALDEVRIDAVIFFAQGGMEGGNALADILTGKEVPSGKLTDTWAYRYEDYPSAESYSYINGELDNEDYREGIYVGYRYFDSFGINPRYPFGFGLSYTDFTITPIKTTVRKTKIAVEAVVKNIGKDFYGKEVVQLYLQKPSKRFDTEEKNLVAFVKTKFLSCGEEETVSLEFDLSQQGCFDEEADSFVLESGEYGVFIGNSSRDISLCSVLVLDEDVVTEKVNVINCDAPKFSDIETSKEKTAYPDDVTRLKVFSGDFEIKTPTESNEKPTNKISKLMERLTDKDKISLVVGGGYSIKCYNNVMGAAGRTAVNLLKKGIPNIILADGPAGININQSTAFTKGGSVRYPDGIPEDWQWGWLKNVGKFMKYVPGKTKPVYHFMTAFPSETLQAQSWNTKLIEEVGKAVGKEMLESGVSVWLAPGLNIHRNPLCGRNFEYYSEDPLVSGKMAAAITKGVQNCGGVGVSVKHFCCNNQEENRMGVSENVSMRALREIYLKGFKIAVTEGKPWTVMTSYNKVNGKYVVNSYDFCTKILRDEWGFEGLVMSDWNSTEKCSYAEAINAGNDLIMPGAANIRNALLKAIENGELDKKALNKSAARVLKVVFKSAAANEF